MRQHTAGFTLVELVVVLVLLGIVTAYAMPRFTSNGYDQLAARQDIRQTLRYAQQLAMSRTADTIRVTSTSASISILINNVPAIRPNGGSYPLSLGNATITPVALTFDSRGALVPALNATIAIEGVTDNICVDGVTGYAYDC